MRPKTILLFYLVGVKCMESWTNSRRSAQVWKIHRGSNVRKRISERGSPMMSSKNLPGSSCLAMNTSAQLAWSDTRFSSTEQIRSVSSSASWPCLLSTSFCTHVVSREYSHFSNRNRVLASVLLSSKHPAEL